MRRTKKDKNTEQGIAIRHAARKLFYDIGYKDTYLEHIARECGMTKQLVAYYIGSKPELALAVTDDYSYENISDINEKTINRYHKNKSFDLQVSTALQIKLETMMYLSDEKAMRFYRETAGLTFENFDINFDDSLYIIHDANYKLDIDRSRDELLMISRLAITAGQTLLIDFTNGRYNCTQQQLLDYTIEIFYRLMNIDRKRIQKINEESNRLIEELDFSFGPYFTIK